MLITVSGYCTNNVYRLVCRPLSQGQGDKYVNVRYFINCIATAEGGTGESLCEMQDAHILISRYRYI